MQYSRLLAAYLPSSRSLLLLRRLHVVSCSDASVSSARLSAWSKIAQVALHREELVVIGGGGGLRSKAQQHRWFCVGASSTAEQVSMEGDGIELETGAGVDLKHDQQALSRDDMSDSYGAGYSTRSSDEGFGQIYGKAAKAVKDRKMAREAAEEEDSDVVDPKAHHDFDHTQGSHVAQKEAARHSEHANAFEDESPVHSRKDAEIANN